MRPRTRRTRQELRSCQDCSTELSDENWTESMQKYRRYICAPCWSARQAKYEEKRRSSNPDLLTQRREMVKARQAGWSEERKEIERRRRYGNFLLKKYGITLERFDEMYTIQNGRCAICKTEKPRGKGGFHVDHCHSTGAVRGLLCTVCNMMLGMAEDNITTLKRAIDYLHQNK